MKNKKFLPAVIFTALFLFSSCSKKNDDTSTVKDNNTQFVAVDSKDIRESDKDLKEVDYRDIYDKLSSKGQWIQVSGKDLNLKSTSSIEKSFQNTLFSIITGVNDACAETQADPGVYFVWKPADNLAVQLGTPASAPPAYVPYVNGKWVNTDAGWYFQAPTPEEEIVHHYGRWVITPAAGYVWVPGRVWAPAWVDWRDNQDNYVAWAPLPPASYIVNDAVPPPPIDYTNYVVVDKKYLVEPDVYKYYYAYPDAPAIVSWTRPQGVVVVNNMIVNRGPDVQIVEKFYGKPIEVVKINHVTNFNEVKYSNGVFNVYTPSFNKFRGDDKVKYMQQPKNFARYEDVRGRENDNKDKGKENNSDQRDIKNIHGNDQDMHKDKDVNRQNNDKGNNDNGNKDKGKGDNGNKDKGNGDNGHKDKGNGDNGHKDKGNRDNGSKDKGDKDNGNEHGKK